MFLKIFAFITLKILENTLDSMGVKNIIYLLQTITLIHQVFIPSCALPGEVKVFPQDAEYQLFHLP